VFISTVVVYGREVALRKGRGKEIRTERVIVEERVETRAVNKDILRVQDAQSPRQVTII